MQFGELLDWEEASTMMSEAVDAGINFLDTAEMYPVPQRAETQGASEEMVGRWLRQRKRDDFVVMTKVAGPGDMPWLRDGPQHLDAANITDAIEASLRRLGTDHVDILLLHWPDRYVPMFGESEYDLNRRFASTPFEQQLQALWEAQEDGKIRYWGVSNETAWGVTRMAALADVYGFTRPLVVQNAFSLLCRTAYGGVAECCVEERVAFLGYSPLAMGLLTGKYRKDKREVSGWSGPADSRLMRYKGRYAEAESRYGCRPSVVAAVTAYAAIAEQAGMSLTELAVRFAVGEQLLSSTVVGASCVEQLGDIARFAARGPLPCQVLEAVDGVHAEHPSPCP